MHRKLYELWVLKGEAARIVDQSGLDTKTPLECYRTAQAHFQQAGVDGDGAAGRRDTARLFTALSQGLLRAKQAESEEVTLEAINLWRQILEERRGVAGRETADIEAMGALAGRHAELANAYGDQLKFTAAGTHHDEAIRLSRGILRVAPTPSHRHDLASALFAKWANHDSHTHSETALDTLEEVVEIRETLVRDFPAIQVYRQQLLNALNLLGNSLINCQAYDEAHEIYDRIIETTNRFSTSDPHSLDWPAHRANALFHGAGL